MGVLAMAVYKAVSNQKALTRVKSQISMRLLEIRLFSHDIRQVLRSTGMILLKNFVYLGNHMLPMVIMLGPVRGHPRAARRELRLRSLSRRLVELLHVQLDPTPAVLARDGGARAARRRRARRAAGRDGRPTRCSGGCAQSSRATTCCACRSAAPSTRRAGRSAALRARFRCAGCAASKRSSTPASPRCPRTGPSSRSSSASTRARSVPLPEGELGIVLWTFVLSLVAGFAVKGLFGVTL
jgi:hypothetical protein